MRLHRNRHFWVILSVFLLLSLIHYVELLGIGGTEAPSSHFGLTRHALERILFLLPIVHAGFIFGLAAGLITCAAALVAMLPRAVLISPAPQDAAFEIVGIAAVGTVACLWLWTRAKEKEQFRAALAELESAHALLQHYVRSARSNERRLTMLNAISTVLAESLELENVLTRAIHMVTELMEVEVALIFLLNAEAQELELVCYEGVSDEFAEAVGRIKVDESIYGKVARTGRLVAVEDASDDPVLMKPEVKIMKIQNQLIVPLTLRDKVRGVLCVAMRRPREYFPEEKELLSAVCKQIAVAVENARLYENQRITAERLAISERNYRELFENANDAIWVHDLVGDFKVANKACEGITGYTREELTQMNVRALLSDEGLNLASRIRKGLLEREPVQQPYEQHLMKKDGTEAIIMLTTSLVTEDGKPTGFQHIARDMTEEMRMKENLRFHLQQATRAQEDERKRMAREFHDDTAQNLFALARQVDNFTRSNKRLAASTVGFLQGLGEQIKAVLEGVRRFSQALRPPMLDDLGLLATLRWLISDLEKQPGMEASLNVVGSERRLEPEAELMIFRIVQEGLRNVERHAQASRADVTVEFGEGTVKVSIADNGRGFDSSGGLADLPRSGRLGLAGIEERTRLLGGTLDIRSELGRGTTVAVEAPV